MTQATETGYKLKLIFPCNCENEKLREVPSKEALFRSSRLISSVVGIKGLPPESLLSENSSVFFESCGFDTDNVKNLISSLYFSIEKMFYPYGLILSCNQQFDNLDAIADWIKMFDCHFKLHNVFNSEENRAEWVIYDYPIIVIEYRGNGENLFEDFFKNKLNCYPSKSETYLGKKILVCDPVVCIEIRDDTDQILHSDIYQIIEVIAAIKHLSSNVRMNLGKIEKDQERSKTNQSQKQDKKTKWLHRLAKNSTEKEKKRKEKEPLLAIQERCEIIHELDCKNIFIVVSSEDCINFSMMFLILRESLNRLNPQKTISITWVICN